METLHLFATEEQHRSSGSNRCWPVNPQRVLDDRPAVASSDARNIQTAITRDGDDYVINGRKWWTSGANDPLQDPDRDGPHQPPMRPPPAAVDDPGADRHPGVTWCGPTSVFGWRDQHGHAEVIYDNVRVPASNLLAGEGMETAIAQARLGQAASTTACARSGWPNVRWHGRTRPHPDRLR